MFEYWLSLSQGGALPRRSDFDPAAAGEMLRACALFDVVVGTSVTCRIAGSLLALALGDDLADRDWLALTPAAHRRQRLIRFSAVAQGAIGVGRRSALPTPGQAALRIEELMLPFASPERDEPHQVLFHSDWRPQGVEWFGIEPGDALSLASEFHLLPLV